MELIRREDAIREMFRFKGYIGFDEDMLYRIEYALNQIPTIDAVPIKFIDDVIEFIILGLGLGQQLPAVLAGGLRRKYQQRNNQNADDRQSGIDVEQCDDSRNDCTDVGNDIG